jgi:tetraacyldisaccharide 4'-kinase
LAVAAIAQPEAFFSMLRARGLRLAQTLALPDHYDFDSWSRPSDEGYTLICTEKDAVKLWRTHADALAVPLICTLEPAFLTALDRLLAAQNLLSRPKLSSNHGHTTS